MKTLASRPGRFLFFMASIFTLFYPSFAIAAPIAARTVHVEGAASYVSIEDTMSRPVALETPFREGDRVLTGADGRVEIQFETGDLVLLDNSTELVIRALSRDAGGATSSVFDLAVGRMKSRVSKFAAGSRFDVNTRAAIAGIAGTEFIVETAGDETNVYNTSEPGGGGVFTEGRDAAKTRVILPPGTGTTVILGFAPAAPFILRPELLKSLGDLFFHTGGAGGGAAAAPAAPTGAGMSGTTIAAIGAGGGLVAVAGSSSGGGGGGKAAESGTGAGPETPTGPEAPTAPTEPETPTSEAPDISGNWAGTWTITSPPECAAEVGSGTWSATFYVSGGQLTGYGSAGDDSGSISGTWDGETASWHIAGGAKGVTFQGKVTGDSISGTFQAEADCWVKGNGGDYPVGPPSGTFTGSRR